MSRIGSSGPAVVRMPQRRQPAEQEAYDPYGAQQQQQPQHGGYGAQGQQGAPQGWNQPSQGYQDPQSYQQPSPYGHQPSAYGQPAYGQPQQPYPQGGYESQYGGYGAPQGFQHTPPQPMVPAPHPFGQAPSYQPEPDLPRAFSQPQQPQPSAYDRYAPQAPQGYAQPQQPAHGGWPQQQQPTHEPRGYDFGHYMPASAPQQPGEPQFQVGPADHFAAGPQDHFQQPQQDYADPDAHYDEGELEEEDEEPRSGRRMIMIAAALVGAIGIGGAMAYTYKTVIAGPRAGAVKTADLKAKPNKENSVSEKKVASRLDDAPPAAQEPDGSDASDDPNAPKKVRIIQIPPGAPAGAEPAAAPPPATPLPGIMLDMGPRPGPQGPAPMPNAGVRPPQGPPAVVASVPTRPAAAPPVRTVAVAPPAQQPEAATPPAPPAAKKERVKAEKAAVPKAKDDQTASINSSNGALGYVAVLSSQKTRVDALKAFADAQQKHPDVLGTKTPDVQEANLGDKGMWYRAVVGPPGSREAAANLCGQLKSAGYNGCWVSAY